MSPNTCRFHQRRPCLSLKIFSQRAVIPKTTESRAESDLKYFGSDGEFTTPSRFCIQAAYFGTSIGVETWTSLCFLVSLLPPPSPPPPTLVFWRTPPVGSYKINTDGRVKDGVASGGGIIRDLSGQCIRAFFSFYGDYTILEAELRAILDEIILAQRLGLSVLWVESDSTLAIHCITKGGGPWHIQATLRHIRHLLALDRDTITHIFREDNQVADLLASEG
ncbi:Uncharacterized protein Adt_05367 [Abeliophyllum distichum]|uniref:RNase H type-1 domain-containing protein n=1 Tax=Abeliophyllum distichum TaxID=126358 RepID=A0ABD1V3X2_9LAMI